MLPPDWTEKNPLYHSVQSGKVEPQSVLNILTRILHEGFALLLRQDFPRKEAFSIEYRMCNLFCVPCPIVH